SRMRRSVRFVFLFQAEDGIRDWSVTGVQTCALPICFGETSAWCNSCSTAQSRLGSTRLVAWKRLTISLRQSADDSSGRCKRLVRSEERRVGKEGRSREWPYA